MSRFRERGKIHKKVSEGDHRLKIIKMIVFLFAGIIGLRLFSLQVINNDFYSALAAGQHEIYKAIFPERGRILMKEVGGNNNSGDEKLYPLATNQSLYLVYADPRKIEGAEGLAEKLVDILYMRNKKEGEELTAEEIEATEKLEKEYPCEDPDERNCRSQKKAMEHKSTHRHQYKREQPQAEPGAVRKSRVRELPASAAVSTAPQVTA